MTDTKRILILTADSGFGHRSAANAVAAALKEQHASDCEVDILNPLDDRRAPFFLRDSAADYDRVVRKAPELYRIGYDLSDNEIPSLLIERVVTVALYEILRDMVRTYRPHAIVTTYPIYQAPLAALFAIRQESIPLATVVTDLVEVHRIWFSPDADLCLVPTPAVRSLALAHGLPPERIHITGVPVSPRFTMQPQDKTGLRRNLGWQPGLTTFLAVGSRRVGRLLEMLHVLNHFGAPLQVAVVAGKDEELLVRLQEIDWHIPAHIYDFVENMPDLLLASDAVLCKAGGLIVTEALASGLPILLVDVIPGQEEGNRDYVLQSGAGSMVETPLALLETLAHWLADDSALLREHARNAAAVGRPNSAGEAAALVWEAAQRGPQARRHRLGRASLIELLTNNKIPWGDV